MSTRERQAVYQRETGCLQERDIRGIPKGDWVSNRGRQGVYRRKTVCLL